MAKKANLINALVSLVPNAKWTMDEYDYDNIDWKSPDITKPSQAEIDAEIIKLNKSYEATEYQRDRQPEYPAIEDQLDDIYHNGIDGWKATIKKVKDKYPKP